MFTLLTKQERETLTKPVVYWLGNLDDVKRDALVAEITGAFHAWQDGQADSAGHVGIETGRGLLSPPKVALVPVKDAEPWQCAGPFVRNDIDLAFKLWIDNDPGFAALLDAHGHGTIFALIGAWSTRTAEHGSLIQLNGLLVDLLRADLRIAHTVGKGMFDEIKAERLRRRESAKAAQAAGAWKRKHKAEREHTAMRTMAIDFARDNPTATQAAIIAYIKSREQFPQATSTIRRIIAGVMSEARNAPRPKPGLYATDHTRNR